MITQTIEQKSYLNNSNLSRQNTKYEYTKDQIEELIKCRDDIVYFANNYFTIVHIDHGKMIIPCYDYQESLLRQFNDNRFNIALQSRQSGKTTTVTMFIMHFILFNHDKNVALLANKAGMAKEILERIKLAFELLPNWMKPSVKTWNKTKIEFDNGCKVSANATSTNSIRGEAVSLLVVDEVAAIPTSVWDAFYTSTYPTISSGKESKVLLISTINGYNHFTKMIEDAKNGRSKFVFSEVRWDDVPDRDEEWKADTIANTSEQAFMQEHENMPLGVSDTLINMKYIKNMSIKTPLYDNNNIKIYEEPQPEHTYISIVDTSRGKGLDNSAISIIDITEYPFKQVATFYDNEISYLIFPQTVNELSSKYNNAYLLIENNDIGGHICAEMNNTYEYENLINLAKNFELGMRTTKRSKALGCSALRDFVENQQLLINDEDTIREIGQFSKKGRSYEAKSGHDDLVMTLVLFGYLTTTEYFEDIQSDNIKRKLFGEKVDRMYEDLLPELVINTGINDNRDKVEVINGEQWIVENF